MGRLMLLRVALVVLVPVGVAFSQDPANPAPPDSSKVAGKSDKDGEALIGTAKETYARLLSEYRAGKADGMVQLELLNLWSRRIVLAETQALLSFASANRADALTRVHKLHEKRMQELGKLVRKRVEQGVSSATEASAASFFELETVAMFEAINRLSSLAQERELDVVLPRASSAEPLTVQPKEIFVKVDQDGSLFVLEERLTLDELANLLTNATKKTPQLSVIIRADKRVELKKVVAVMNVCNRVGVFDYTLTTEPK